MPKIKWLQCESESRPRSFRVHWQAHSFVFFISPHQKQYLIWLSYFPLWGPPRSLFSLMGGWAFAHFKISALSDLCYRCTRHFRPGLCAQCMHGSTSRQQLKAEWTQAAERSLSLPSTSNTLLDWLEMSFLFAPRCLHSCFSVIKDLMPDVWKARCSAHTALCFTRTRTYTSVLHFASSRPSVFTRSLRAVKWTHYVNSRTVSTTQLGTDVNAAKKVTMATRLWGRAEFARARSAWPQTGGWQKHKAPPNSCTIIKCIFQEIKSWSLNQFAVSRSVAQSSSETSSAYAEQATPETGVRGECLCGQIGLTGRVMMLKCSAGTVYFGIL